MRRLRLIGIGAGHPDHVTIQAVQALNEFDVLFVVTKDDDTSELVEHRRAVVARHRHAGPFRTVTLADPPRPWRDADDYRGAVANWRAQRAAQWGGALRDGLADGECGAFLVWGDPALYESTLTVIAELAEHTALALDYDVIPGISSVQALTAAHRIPLNRVGRAVQVSPARLLAGGMPDGVDDVVVMLDAQGTFERIPADGIEIFWGAYLGTPDELLVAGPLGEVAGEIARLRAEAKRRKGWMFDTYLLRRSGAERG
ncbi:MAG: Precorrin-6A synthase (deacetylating) [uncultured Solirubrobacteraceae bacterium]|uniref:Precorrin-6A synthase (Deacetylating) n=1 Tax=uncultured Solirubrobacteraceae bacterium TaxID=1162706 RepID=A0A6J4SHA9_9ACTN|nr:MAG: Precorrin-6A synthase (deacetylating) [uncultured Solirubrobacteraceae bacterium]